MRAKKLKLNGKTVSYFDEGRGFPVLMVYGWVVDKHAFEPVGEILKKNYRIVIPDLPGHGDSQELDKRHDFAAYLNFLDSFVKALRLEKFHLAGASLGGTLALLYTLRNKKIVERLILNAPVVSCRQLPGVIGSPILKPVFNTLGNVGFFQRKFHDRFRNYAFSTRLPRLKGNLDPKRWKEVGSSVEAVMNSFDRKLSRRASSEFGMSVLGVDLWDRLGKINQKTLVIWGGTDATLDKRAGLKICRLMPEAEYLEIAGGSHDVLVEKHREMASGIESFLS